MERDATDDLLRRPASVPLCVYSQLAEELNALRQENRALREANRQLQQEQEHLLQQRTPEITKSPSASPSWNWLLTPNKT